MKVLVVGGGGREHALAWKIARSPLVTQVFAAPGNAGIAEDAECVDVSPTDVQGLAALVEQRGIDLTVIGPEGPLAAGIVDHFRERGLLVAGPIQAHAQLESSKAFTKQVLIEAGVPTAEHRTFTDPAEARAYVRERGAPIVVKADGLAAGKGVTVATTVEEAEAAVTDCLEANAFGDAGATVLIEDFLAGEEASFIVLANGDTVQVFPSSQDHKRLLDGDEGPNTGGMGAYSPAPVVTPELERTVLEQVIRPTLDTVAGDGEGYRGFLYAGLMVQNGTPSVLEYNVRFGDPEAQPVLMRLRSDLVPALLAVAKGEAFPEALDIDPRPAVCIVMAAGGYPGSYAKGLPIEGLEDAARLEDVKVFHAGTARDGDRIVTTGGRVLGVTALGDTLDAAVKRAYEAVRCISWKGVQYRTDIAAKALDR